jgi:membrane-associated phospholipid phosphatase
MGEEGSEIQNAHPYSAQNPGGRPSPLWHLVGVLLVLSGVVIAHLVPRTDGSDWVRVFSDICSKRGNDVYLTLGIGTLLWLAYKERSKMAFWRVATPLLVETGIMQTCQKVSFHVFGLWPRPSGTDGGFPSGHAAASCVVAYLLTERFPWGAPLWYTAAALITWSRVESGAHYPYQIVGGVILGFTVVTLLVPRFYPSSPPVLPPVEK